MKKITFKIYTLGCKVNQYDSGSLGRKLKSLGFISVRAKADLAVVNTCAVTETAIRKNRRMLKRARRENPTGKIALLGCWPKVYPEEKKNLPAVWFIGKKGTGELIDKIKREFSLPASAPRPSSFSAAGKRARYFLKIQDGCEQFCSYCVIPYARGKLKSRPADGVKAEVEKAAAAGYGEIVLCGIHLGLYGRETKDEKNNLVNLLWELIRIKNLGRIRLSSIEVTEVSSSLISLMARSGKICRHLHLPLQAGSDRILKAMNRPYDSKYFKDKVKQIRKAMPDIAITTDIIAGFPGETEKDFMKTYNFIKETRFSRLHIFPFSAHERTPAAKMEKRVEEKEIKSRAEKLRALGEELAREYKKKFEKRELEVAVEGKLKNGKLKGKSEYYFDVEFAKRQAGSQKKCAVSRLVKVSKWK